ncbi:MAG: hypothetical protein QM642_11355 [Edaphocola sp.]
MRAIVFILIMVGCCNCCGSHLYAQASPDSAATKKRSFFGKIGHGIRTSFGKDTSGRRVNLVELNTDPLLPFEGKIIRNITSRRLGFEANISDSAGNLVYFGTKIINSLHATSKSNTVLRNVYLKEGTKFNSYLAADNERHLRTVSYVQDARIIARAVGSDSVDLEIVTKDIFAYSPKIGGLGPKRQRFGLANINLLGTGQEVWLEDLHDDRRTPTWGFGTGYGYTSLWGSFINMYLTYTRIGRNIYDRREDEENMLVDFQLPLVSQYRRWAGGLSVGKSKSLNMFPNYNGGDYYRYNYGVGDVWAGYNVGALRYLNNQELHVKKFLSIRYFHYKFFESPWQINENTFDQRFNSRQGALISLTLFRQYYYKTRYIYGFGITEDVPSGFNVSVTAGWYKQLWLSRPYLGVDGYRYIVSNKRDLACLFFRAGGFVSGGTLQDVGFMAGGSMFTRLISIDNTRVRQYFRFSYAGFINRVALNPLRINNVLGLRNFNSELASGNNRLALRGETTVFLRQKFFGFRLAPFASGDFIYLTDSHTLTDNSGFFYGIGGGLRTRNENFQFGTIELRALVNPRKIAGDSRIKLSVVVNLQFRYNNSYVSKPDIVELNSDVTGDIY